MAEIEVREAREDEFPEVTAITLEAYAEFEAQLSQEWWRYYRRDLAAVAERAKQGRYLVAVEAGTLVGAVALVAQNGTPWIRTLAVLPAARGKGIGRRLTEVCIEAARAAGAEAIGLNTTFLMPVAKAMYERMGFQQVGEHTDWPAGAYWTYSMSLR
jgi:ribosomal protein S18 acetylase RimI-like enzyme